MCKSQKNLRLETAASDNPLVPSANVLKQTRDSENQHLVSQTLQVGLDSQALDNLTSVNLPLASPRSAHLLNPRQALVKQIKQHLANLAKQASVNQASLTRHLVSPLNRQILLASQINLPPISQRERLAIPAPVALGNLLLEILPLDSQANRTPDLENLHSDNNKQHSGKPLIRQLPHRLDHQLNPPPVDLGNHLLGSQQAPAALVSHLQQALLLGNLLLAMPHL